MRILYHILYPDGMGDDRFIYDGYKFAFEDLGHVVRPLTEREDFETVVKDFKPDIFITRQALFYDKFVGDVNSFLDKIENFRRQGVKVIFEIGQYMAQVVFDRIKNGHLADVYFIHGAYPEPPFKKITGKDFYNLPLAASCQYHFPVEPVEKYRCDIVFIGANLPRKKEAFRRRLLPLFKKYDVRVYGGDWDWLDRYFLHPLAKIDRIFNLGGSFSRLRIKRQVPIGDENKVYASAKICLNFHEDNPERLVNGRTFKIAASGGFQVCDYEPLVWKYFAKDEIVMPEKDSDWFGQIDYFLNHPAERKKMQTKATANVLANHTYHNRVQTMLGWL